MIVDNTNDGGRRSTHPQEDNDCVIRALTTLTGRSYPEIHKDIEIRYGRKPGETTKNFDAGGVGIWKQSEVKGLGCGDGNSFSLYGLNFNWIPTTRTGRQVLKPPTVGELQLTDGMYLLDICNYQTSYREYEAGYRNAPNPEGGHHVVPVIDNVALDNNEAYGLEDGVVVGYWKVEGPQTTMRDLTRKYSTLLASATKLVTRTRGGMTLMSSYRNSGQHASMRASKKAEIAARVRKIELASQVSAALDASQEFGGKPNKGTKADGRLKENKGKRPASSKPTVGNTTNSKTERSFRGLLPSGRIQLSGVDVLSFEHFEGQRGKSGRTCDCQGGCN